MDDEEMIQTLLKIMLEKFGFDVELTSDGNQAIDIYCKALEVGDRFDIVIMDLTIPGGLGGKDAAKDLLQIDPDAKIIVSSGYANDPVMSNYTEFGFKGIVTKPFTKDQLIEAINKVM